MAATALSDLERSVVEHWMRLAGPVVSPFSHRAEREELLAVCGTALAEAAPKIAQLPDCFGPKGRARNYAYTAMTNAVRCYCNQGSRLIVPGRAISRLCGTLPVKQAELLGRLGREPTVEELAAELHKPAWVIRGALRYDGQVESLEPETELQAPDVAHEVEVSMTVREALRNHPEEVVDATLAALRWSWSDGHLDGDSFRLALQNRLAQGGMRSDRAARLASAAIADLRDPLRHGATPTSLEKTRSRISRKVRLTIVRMSRQGAKQESIARTVGVTVSCVSKVLHPREKSPRRSAFEDLVLSVRAEQPQWGPSLIHRALLNRMGQGAPGIHTVERILYGPKR